MTEAEARTEVMAAIIADRNRSIESAIARGIQAGIKLERARIAAILELPTPAGLREAAITLALNNASLESVAGLFALHAVAPPAFTDAEIEARRTFH